jgi:hypothetical protein
MLLESELDLAQQAATTFRAAFEGSERELKAVQDAKADVLAKVSREPLGPIPLLFLLHRCRSWSHPFPALCRSQGNHTLAHCRGGVGVEGARRAMCRLQPPP